MEEPTAIKKLDEVVYNRIAAGEVIQRPANALKEMIENSLDAKSTNIQVTVRNGGLKLLQILDNGVGIRKEDFEMVCERFATSKLQKFEDLQSISTYGFRGEALASISHVAQLTLISKTAKEKCAYKATYEDGKLKDAVIPIAGNQGTLITVENLFYNVTVRKNTLRSPAEEYQKISDVIGKYAIHNHTIGFCLKKHGDRNDIRTPPRSTVVDNIRTIYGNNIARELIEFNMENDPFKFKVNGWMTNVNYSTKKMQFILFINHRLVDCQSLKKCIDQIYMTYLPKNTHPFVYMSLQIEPKNIDVNVHPTKHEVHFLNEEQIVEIIATAVETKLLGSNNSRVFYTQAKLPTNLNTSTNSETKNLNKTVHDKNLVRTDASEQKLEKFFGPTVKKSEINSSFTEKDFVEANEKFLEQADQFENKLMEKSVIEESPEKSVTKNGVLVDSTSRSFTSKKLQSIGSGFERNKTLIPVKLKSVMDLQAEVENNCDDPLREVFAEHVFVGSISSQRSLIQHGTSLYLCDTEKILRELFYQFLVFNFQNFDVYKLTNPLPIKQMARFALDLDETGWTPEDGDKDELAEKIAEILMDKGEMLDEYFSMEIDQEGNLKTLPILIDKHVPEMSGLPMYILRLATEVNWDEEKECFESFSRETALYYAQIEEKDDWKFLMENVIYPSIKDYFCPNKSFKNNGAILQIADLPNLYKVFERC